MESITASFILSALAVQFAVGQGMAPNSLLTSKIQS